MASSDHQENMATHALARQDAAEMVELVESEKRIEALLKELKNDRAVVHKVIPYMPEDSQLILLPC